MKSAKLFHHAPATQRNRDPILKVLQTCLPDPASVLEIASGTGEHAVYLSSNLPQVIHWQPTDIDPTAISSIEAWRQRDHHPKLRPALHLDVMATPQIIPSEYNTLLAINMIHIAPWQAAEGLMKLAQSLLCNEGILYLYGPFWQDDVSPVDSNLAFDASLRQRNPLWGIRNLEEVTHLAEVHGLARQAVIPMPANNLSVIFRKE
ncbi:DUF938 domain-containing protein [Nitrincola sp.]|uniref:DUF938 domain-containing protein n=1 Tax=Nitrincola sp. TaxID=1926584 RepID=UPI003A95D91D